MKEKMLIHICCGPCSVAIFEELMEQFEVTVHFYNPNIHPVMEYERRKEEVVRLCNGLGIEFVEGEYNPIEWLKLTEEYKDESEGGRRCPVCFEMRLEKAAEYAGKHGFDYLATSLTSGRNKFADVINPIGIKAAEKFSIKFFEEDWKKKGRQEKATKMTKEKGIYRQDYCGCIYSLK